MSIFSFAFDVCRIPRKDNNDDDKAAGKANPPPQELVARFYVKDDINLPPPDVSRVKPLFEMKGPPPKNAEIVDVTNPETGEVIPYLKLPPPKAPSHVHVRVLHISKKTGRPQFYCPRCRARGLCGLGLCKLCHNRCIQSVGLCAECFKRRTSGKKGPCEACYEKQTTDFYDRHFGAKPM